MAAAFSAESSPFSVASLKWTLIKLILPQMPQCNWNEDGINEWTATEILFQGLGSSHLRKSSFQWVKWIIPIAFQ